MRTGWPKCYDEINKSYRLEGELVGGGRNTREVVLDTVVRKGNSQIKSE